MSAQTTASKLAEAIRKVDRAYWHATGSSRIGAREYYRQRRPLANAYSRVLGFIDAGWKRGAR